MIRNHDQSLREIDLKTPAAGDRELSAHAFIPTDPNHGRTEQLRIDGDHQAKGLFCQSHIRIVIILIDQVEGSSEKLSQRYAEDARTKPGGQEGHPDSLHNASMFDMSSWMRFNRLGFHHRFHIRQMCF